ncbi:MAG: spermidine synthase [Acidobacteriota bacterium]|nr:MAG: spermidine synthase [Acidobacteriota bacterium]
MIRELAYHATDLGPLMLRVRPEPLIGGSDVFEVKLGEEFLMSSLFTAGEEALADLGLSGLQGKLDVVVGGLGLGYTAARALENRNVASLLVIEAFGEVIGWHMEKLVPAGEKLTGDPRCRFLEGDFFRLAKTGFDPSDPLRKFDAVLLDIDHTPDHHLDRNNAGFYTSAGLEKLKSRIKPGGRFAMWSNDESDDDFVNLLKTVFGIAEGHNVKFANPYTNELAVNSVYVATV